MANDVFERIQTEINEAPVMLYMKGTAMFPQCGFSARVVQILTHMGVPFKTANVLEDMELREGIKQFSQWPTVPQLYVKGEFVGGCDIVTGDVSVGRTKADRDRHAQQAEKSDSRFPTIRLKRSRSSLT